MSGRNGDSVFIKVPCGTIVSEEDDLDLFELDDDDVSGEEVMGRRIELNHDKEMVLVALGGKPGLGNKVTISGKNRNNQVTVSDVILFLRILRDTNSLSLSSLGQRLLAS